MSEEPDYVRVVNIRADDDNFCPIPAEKLIMVDRINKILGNRHVMKVKSQMEHERVIMMDRTHPSMGNRHVMKTQSRLERDRVIEAYQVDLDADIARKGPMYQTMMAIAFDIVDRGDKVALQCF